MSLPASLLPELEEAIQRGSPGKRASTLRQITDLFVGGTAGFGPELVGVFDDVIGLLITEIETQALAELSRRIAPVPNAPAGVMRTLARNDDIAVAGPVLRLTPLAPVDLKHIAETKSQAHLLAISERAGITEQLSDILVQRGDGAVVRSIATNRQAPLSENAFVTLVQRAKLDGVLAERVGTRSDIPPRLFRQLLMQATDVVRQRLLAQARPETQAEIRRVLDQISDHITAGSPRRDYSAALALVRDLHKDGRLDEAKIVEFAKSNKYEETIAGLATVCAVPIETVDRLLSGERLDPVIILVRAAGFSWNLVRAVITSRPNGKPASADAIEAAQQNFDTLSSVTAERVVRFWQVRPPD